MQLTFPVFYLVTDLQIPRHMKQLECIKQTRKTPNTYRHYAYKAKGNRHPLATSSSTLTGSFGKGLFQTDIKI